MRKLVVLLALLTTLVVPTSVAAHPLGNFTSNQLVRVEASGERLYVLYVLDLAEVPTFQARAQRRALGEAAYVRSLVGRVLEGVEVSVDGRARRLRPLERRLALPAGAAGLRTTRLELVLDAGPLPGEKASIGVRNRTFASRIGWREIVVTGTHGARVLEATTSADSVSDELRTYPEGLLDSPLDVREARASVLAGRGAGVPPSLGDVTPGAESPSRHGLAALVGEEDLGPGIVLVMLGAALFWGAAHALTPGHGKAIVAAYLVGARGTARHALLLGLIVTVTHTIGVFALGVVTLALSELVVPEQLYPWLNLASALLVVLVGATVLRLRVREWVRRRHADGRSHPHHHHHHHDHHHDHGHAGHAHVPAAGGGLRGLVAVGVSGGLLPCPTALVVLLAAVSLHRVGLGLVLIVAFSVGLASVIAGIGLLAVSARRVFTRMRLDGPLVRALPAASAALIVGLGVAMTLRALPSLT